ncbi:MAG: serine--tRNA ligase [Thermoleophilaceae bacterium]
MLDMDLIRRDPDAVARELRKRADDVDLGPLLQADEQLRESRARLDSARTERKRIGEEIGRRRRAGEDSAELEGEATRLREAVAANEQAERELEESLRVLQLELPNLPDPRVPEGGKEANQVVKVWGQKPQIENLRDHVELSELLGLVDYERGTKLSGRGFWIYRGLGAALEWALLDFFCREHHADGYEFLLPPHLLLEKVGYDAGQFPKFRDDVFHIEADEGDRGRFLLPTAETAILGMRSEEVLDERELPLKSFAYTPCYRSERGGYRTEERGTVRGHQFNKVEIFQVVAPEGAEAALAELIGKAEGIVEKLGLHYRTSLLGARDASASMAITYDVEVWMPSMDTYKEVSSASHAADYQARRANIRFRREGQKRREYVHTLNASALATSRVVPALLEQNQQPDGSVRIPEPLQPWLGTDVLKPRG